MQIQFCIIARSLCIDDKTDKSELTYAQWDPITQECLIVTQAQYLDIYYRVDLSNMGELENPLGVVQEKESIVTEHRLEKQQKYLPDNGNPEYTLLSFFTVV